MKDIRILQGHQLIFHSTIASSIFDEEGVLADNASDTSEDSEYATCADDGRVESPTTVADIPV